MKPILAAGLLLALFLPFAVSPAGGQSLEEALLAEARGQVEAGRYLEAVGLLQELNTPLTRKRRADILSHFLEKKGEAIPLYEAALEGGLPPGEEAGARFGLAMLQFESNRFGEALGSFRRFLQDFPRHPRAPTARFMEDLSERYLREGPPKPSAAPRPEGGPAEERWVRVALAQGAGAVRLEGELDVSADGRPIGRLPGLEVRAAGRELRVEGVEGSFSRIRAVPAGGPVFRFGGRRYRGEAHLEPSGGGMLLMNRVPFRAYLYGVVPGEVPSNWPLEALKAQTVAARSYALYQLARREGEPFDVHATVASQVYRGYDAERESTNRAVDETAGEVLTYGGGVIIAYFHSHSGGYTERASSVWGVDFPYFQAVPDPYSAKAPVGPWRASYSLAEVATLLRRGRYQVGGVEGVEPLSRTASGRVGKVALRHGGGTLSLAANTFRLRLGGERLKSTLFEVSEGDGRVEFRGRGFGHGVGLSQWGAYAMAAEGLSYREILAFYYPGTRLERR